MLRTAHKAVTQRGEDTSARERPIARVDVGTAGRVNVAGVERMQFGGRQAGRSARLHSVD